MEMSSCGSAGPHHSSRSFQRAAWKDALLLVPGIGRNQPCRNVFTGEVLTTGGLEGQACLPLAEVFAHFPVALFLAPVE
jgi:maltooligosyltrehalose synthase